MFSKIEPIRVLIFLLKNKVKADSYKRYPSIRARKTNTLAFVAQLSAMPSKINTDFLLGLASVAPYRTRNIAK